MKFADAEKGYANLWAKARVTPARRGALNAIIERLSANRERYQAVSDSVGGRIPWWWIAITHNLEAGGRFDRHLHNGDPLTNWTRRVPVNRPLGGKPPFTWEFSAADALRMHGLDKIVEWSIPRALYEFERFNGFGYVKQRINSPYVWSFTNLYTRGKYVADHQFDASAVSQQAGAAAIMKVMLETLEGDEMEEQKQLTASLIPFGAVAPLLVQAVRNGGIQMALRAITEALGDETPAKPDAVVEALEVRPLSAVADVLRRAEEIISVFTPAEPIVKAEEPIPVLVVGQPAVPAAPAASPVAPVVAVQQNDSWWDSVVPAGWKTALGIIIYCAAWAGQSLGYVTPETGSALLALGTAFAGVGIAAKLDRWAPILGAVIKKR
jgi:lysozyme family protein